MPHYMVDEEQCCAWPNPHAPIRQRSADRAARRIWLTGEGLHPFAAAMHERFGRHENPDRRCESCALLVVIRSSTSLRRPTLSINKVYRCGLQELEAPGIGGRREPAWSKNFPACARFVAVPGEV